MVFLNNHNFNLFYKSLVRPHCEYGIAVLSSLLKNNITLIENVQRRATRYFQNIKELEYYHERLEALNLPQLHYKRFRIDIIQAHKITHGYFDETGVGHLLEMKSTYTRGHQYAIKTRHSNNAVSGRYFAFPVVSA